MPKRKPDQVIRHEFALNRADREMVEQYLTFSKADKASETVSQIITSFTSSDGGLIAAWFVLDLIDNWAIPKDGLDDIISYINTDPSWKDLAKWALPFLAPVTTPYVVASEVAETVTEWAAATREEKEAAHPFRVKINDVAKTGKWLIFIYFAGKFGDDWIQALSGLLPGTESGGSVPPIPV